MKRIALFAAIALGLVGCSDGSDVTTVTEGKTITVFAASSLSETFTELGKQFEAENPGVTVKFNFDGSSGLVTQLQEGARADVFASADIDNMDKASAADLLGSEPAIFATNTLEIATPPGNPAGVDELADLADPGIVVVLCAPEVPCGAAAAAIEANAGIDISPASEEQNVTDVLGKVASGEADAGLVYVTDVARAGDTVEGVAFDESASVVNRYPIARLADSQISAVADQFIDFVQSQVGQDVLAEAGFGAP